MAVSDTGGKLGRAGGRRAEFSSTRVRRSYASDEEPFVRSKRGSLGRPSPRIAIGSAWPAELLEYLEQHEGPEVQLGPSESLLRLLTSIDRFELLPAVKGYLQERKVQSLLHSTVSIRPRPPMHPTLSLHSRELDPDAQTALHKEPHPYPLLPLSENIGSLRRSHLESGARSNVRTYDEDLIPTKRHRAELLGTSIDEGPLQVVGETNITVKDTVKTRSYEWIDYGLKMTVPKGALPVDHTECTLTISAAIAGNFELPEGAKLISAMYYISSPIEFAKPVQVEIQHCAVVTQPNDFSFVIAKDLPGVVHFSLMSGGVFVSNHSYATIQLNHFCYLAVVVKSRLLSWFRSKIEQRYMIQLFGSAFSERCWKVYFVVVKHLNICFSVVANEVLKGKMKLLSMPAEFKDDCIALDVPEDGKETEDGWRIEPCFKPLVRRTDVEQYNGDLEAPKCELMLTWNGYSNRGVLPMVKLHVKGTKDEGKFCKFDLSKCINKGHHKEIEGNNPLICCSTTLTVKNSGFRLDYLRVVGYVGQNGDGTPDSAGSDSGESSDHMDEDDLSDVYKQIKEAASSWRNIATELRFSLMEQNQITHLKGLHEDDHYLHEMLGRWLKRAPPDHDFPQRDKLCKALRSVGEEKIAYELANCMY